MLHALLLFDVSGGEFILIVLAIILLFGSKGIPEIARVVGKGMREFRTATDTIKREISESGQSMKEDLRKEAIRPFDEAFSDEHYLSPPPQSPYDADFDATYTPNPSSDLPDNTESGPTPPSS
ncbi:MAG: twin-arginine translocase TatA/TatE family subunit [Bacteroidetes bacterium]|jgi:TatA/E family protein of Tat protein translocase|nr:twin-arginine translocase TatA/TatE family subunit [Bacteroidota bacterium]MDA0931211.1 twin-arginine translocase TatA/TatE family subunit [Bacteroidota bacterium]